MTGLDVDERERIPRSRSGKIIEKTRKKPETTLRLTTNFTRTSGLFITVLPVL